MFPRYQSDKSQCWVVHTKQALIASMIRTMTISMDFNDDEGDLTVEGPSTLEHSSTASDFLPTNIGRHRSSLLNQSLPHSVHPPPHSLQLSPHTVHPVPRPRTPRYTSSHPYYRLPSSEHDWQHSSWYEHTVKPAPWLTLKTSWCLCLKSSPTVLVILKWLWAAWSLTVWVPVQVQKRRCEFHHSSLYVESFFVVHWLAGVVGRKRLTNELNQGL